MNLNKNYFLFLFVILISSMFVACGDEDGDSVVNLRFDYSTNRFDKNKFEVTSAEGEHNTSFWLERDSIGYSKLDAIRKIEVLESEFYYTFAEENNEAKDLVKTIKVTLSIKDSQDEYNFEIKTDKSMSINLADPEYKILVQKYIEKIYKDSGAGLIIKTTMLDAEDKPVSSVKFNVALKANFDLHVRWIGDIDK